MLDSRLRSAGGVCGQYVQKSKIDGAASSSPVVSGSPSWAVKRSLQNNDTAMRNITNSISAPTTPTTRHDRPGLVRRDQRNYDHSSSFQSTDQLRLANLDIAFYHVM